MAQRFGERPMNEGDRLTREITEAELKEHSTMLAAIIERYNRVEEEKAESNRGFTKELKDLRSEMNRLARIVKTGRVEV
jgi:archaellum component FlaC